MGRGRGKSKKFTLTNNDDPGSGEEEKIPTQKRRGRPQKPLVDEIDDDFEKLEVEDDDNANVVVSGKESEKKRKRDKPAKEKGDLVKEESGNGSNGTRSSPDGSTQANGFRHNGSRRKNKPRRAAEAGVECK